MKNKDCIVIAKFGKKYTSDMMFNFVGKNGYKYAAISIEDCKNWNNFIEYLIAFVSKPYNAMSFIQKGNRLEFFSPKGIDVENDINCPIFTNEIQSVCDAQYKLMYDFDNECWYEIVYTEDGLYFSKKLESNFSRENPMKIYLSMPVTGYDVDERMEFANIIKNKFTNDIHEVVTPFDTIPDNANMTWEECMKICINELTKCDAILLSHDWMKSKGCRVENLVAQSCGIMIAEEIYF